MSKVRDGFKARSLIVKIIIAVVAIGVIGNIFGGGDPVEEVEAAPATTSEAVVETTTTTEAPTTTTTTQPPTTTTVAELPDDAMESLFLAFVRDWSRDQPLNIIDTATDSMLIDLALSTCQALDGGVSLEDIATVAALSLAENDSLTDANVEAVGIIIGAGVEAFCPQHSGKLG